VSGFYDATCRRCKNKIGWTGELINRPSCPRCGDRPTDEQLLSDSGMVEEFSNLLACLRHATAQYKEWKQAREMTGLSKSTVTELIEISVERLDGIESGEIVPTKKEIQFLKELYKGTLE
jgi:ribosome-binding protein aMBF1 (putative translation factor)